MTADGTRELLTALKARLAKGEIDEATYDRQRDRILADLSPVERAEFGVTPSAGTPPPGTPLPATLGPINLGPSGGRGGGLLSASNSLSDLDLRAGTVLLGQWRVERELGRGGFGVVLLAEELVLKQRQAVKVLDPAMVAREDLLERFRREVRSTRALVHARIVRVYDYREDLAQGLALFSMEYIEGTSVAGLLRNAREKSEPVPVPLALAILEQMLEALGGAHGAGVIHRDVTPANVLLAGGSAEALLKVSALASTVDPAVKLVDFGIAGAIERSELSQKSRVLGTAAYVAPEVLDPTAEVTPAADVYGAGAVLYELLTGKLPLGRFEDPSACRKEIPRALDELVLALLSPVATRRPSANKARQAMVALIDGLDRDTGARAEWIRGRPVQLREVPAGVEGEATARRGAATGSGAEPGARSSAHHPPVIPVPGPHVLPTARIAEDVRGSSAAAAVPAILGPQERSRSKGLVLGAAALVLVALGGGLYLATRSGERKGPPPEALKAPEERRVATTAAVPPAKPVEAPNPSPPQASVLSPQLAGTWEVEIVIDHTTYAPFQGLTAGYSLSFSSEGSSVTAVGRKVSENGSPIPENSQNEIRLKGTIEGNQVAATYTLFGSKRSSVGEFRWTLSSDGKKLEGTFTGDKSETRGRSIGHRVR